MNKNYLVKSIVTAASMAALSACSPFAASKWNGLGPVSEEKSVKSLECPSEAEYVDGKNIVALTVIKLDTGVEILEGDYQIVADGIVHRSGTSSSIEAICSGGDVLVTESSKNVVVRTVKLKFGNNAVSVEKVDLTQMPAVSSQTSYSKFPASAAPDSRDGAGN